MKTVLYACAVCFGADDSSGLAKGLTWGLFLLLAFTFGILGALVKAIHEIEKGRAKAEAEEGLRANG